MKVPEWLNAVCKPVIKTSWGALDLQRNVCVCVSFLCTCRSHPVFPPGLYMYMCPSLNVALCVPFSRQCTAHSEEAACRYIWRLKTLSLRRCMSLLISPFFLVILCFLNLFFFSFPPPCVETVTFLWGVDFVSTSGVCLTSKCNQRKKEKKKKKATRLISTRLRRSRRIWFWSILSPHPSCSSSLVVVSSALSSVASCQLSSCASSLSPVTKSLVPYVFFYVFLCYLHELARRGVFSVFSPLLFFSSSLGWLCAVECSSCVFFFSLPVSLSLSLLCRGCAVPDGWGPQTDPSAARGDGWYSELKGLLAVRHSTLCKKLRRKVS